MATSSPIWTLVYSGVEKSFAAWGLRNLARRQSSQSQYQVTFTGQRVPFDGTPQFPYLSTIIIKRNGVKWWQGPVISIPKLGSAKTQQIDYVVASPWYYLQNLGYQQEWAIFTGSAYVKRFSSHLYIGQGIQWNDSISGLPLTIPNAIRSKTNTVLKDILDYAINQSSVPIAYNAADLADANAPMSIYIPVDEAREISCAEAIRRVTKWLRDVVVWWDFTTTIPTIRFQRRTQLATATLNIGYKPLFSVELTPRYDLQVSAVCLNYEQTNEVDGVVSLNLTPRFAPTSIPTDDAHATAYAAAAAAASKLVGAMVCTIDLKGMQATNVYASLETASINASSVNWWKRRYPWMTDDAIQSIEITNPTRNYPTGYPCELVSGSWGPWIAGVNCVNDTIQATAKVTYKKTGSATPDKIDYKQLSAKIRVTNAPADTITNYSTTASFEGGDAIPDTLHTDLFNSLTGSDPSVTLQHSGQIVLREAECGDWLATAGAGGTAIAPQAGIGLAVNIAGGTGAFAAINAIVQSCDEDIDGGTTSLTVGPPEQLGPQDLVALLQVTRNRQIYNNPRTQGQGLTGDGGQFNYPKEGAGESANSHTTGYEKLTISTPTTTGYAQPLMVLSQGAQKCEIDLAHLIDFAHATPVKIDAKFRKIKYCKGNVQYNMWVLCSVPYDNDGNPIDL